MALIEREPIEKFIEDGLNSKDRLKQFGNDAIKIMTEVHFAPTIDPVHAAGGCYCRECEHYGVDIEKGQFCMRIVSLSMWTDGITPLKPDDFCSYGRRKVGADD